MKQTLFMIVITGFGTMGVLFHPFYGVAVYTLYAVLRPQFMWDWALPPGVAWSRYVAIATILGGIGMALSLLPATRDEEEPNHSGLSASHYLIAIFAVWIVISYVTAYDRDVAEFYFDEYMKIFTMLIVSTIIVRKIDQLWILYLITTCALAYIAYEVNIKYLTEGRLDIWLNGYGGVDNNGAGLMLAIGVPLSVFAWEGTKRWYRWIYLAFVPPILHAVMMTYSRGAMLAVLVGAPLMAIRGQRWRQFLLAFIVLAAMVPFMAGKEIRNRFFSIDSYERDSSASSRLGSWQAAISIANNYPIFGVGLRNSPLFSYRYGADMRGRVIHSQYLQVLADTGYPGLLIYLSVLFTTWRSLRRVCRMVRGRTDVEAQRIRSMANGLESGLLVFCVAASFLSVELFELPYILLFLSAQLYVIQRAASMAQPAQNEAPVRIVAGQLRPASLPQPAKLRTLPR